MNEKELRTMDQPPRAAARRTSQEPLPLYGAKGSHRPNADLKAYLDGELPYLRRRLTARHIGRCRSCREEIRALEEISRCAQNLEHATPSPRLRARILASLPDTPPATVSPLSAVSRPAASSFRSPSLALGSLCAALSLAVFGSAYALNFWHSANIPADIQMSLAVQTSPPTAPTFAAKSNPIRSGPARTHEPSNNDPFAPSAIANTTAPDNASETDVASAANRSASPSVAGAVSAETYTDPISREADRLAAQPIKAKLREKQQKLAAAKPPVVPPGQRLASVKGGNAATTQLAFAVANVSEARRQVQKWAEEAGAEMTVLAYTAAKTSPPDETAAAASVHAPEEEAQTPALLKLKVPAQRAESFRSCLSQMGTLVPARSDGKGVERMQPLIAQEDFSQRLRLPMMPVFTPDHAAHGETRKTFTIVLRLQPGSLTSH